MNYLYSAILALSLMLTGAQNPVFFGQNHAASSGGSSTVTVADFCIDSNSGTSTLSCTIHGAASGGYFLVYTENVVVPSTQSMLDSNTGALSRVGSQVVWSAGSQTADLFQVVNGGSGDHTFTVTFGGGTHFAALQAVYMKGASTTSPLATSTPSTGNLTGPDTIDCGSVTTTSANEFGLLFVSGEGGVHVTPGTSPQILTTVPGTDITNGEAASTSFVTAGSSNFGTFNFSSGAQWSCITAVVH